jgi:hypothetical protein
MPDAQTLSRRQHMQDDRRQGERREGERRVWPRTRVLKKGRIVFNERRSVIDCTIRNLSPAGALLIVRSLIGIPDCFDLSIDSDAVNHAARVIWKRDDQIGVKFV